MAAVALVAQSSTFGGSTASTKPNEQCVDEIDGGRGKE
jgi:hypothetical protein